MERIQHDSFDGSGNPVRLVYERSEGEMPSGVVSKIHYWVDDFRIDLTLEDAKRALEVYKGLKCSVKPTITVDELPKVEVNQVS